MDNIHKLIARGRSALLVCLNVSAAFNSVDHSILLHRLETDIGITGRILSWFESYLTAHKQLVFIHYDV